jgi:hypothetical protein
LEANTKDMNEMIKSGIVDIALSIIVSLLVLYATIRIAVTHALSMFFDTKQEVLDKKESLLKSKTGQ